MAFLSKNNCDSTSHPLPTIRNAKDRDISEIATTIISSFYNNSGIFVWLYPLLKFTVSEDLRYRLGSSVPLYQCLVATLTDKNAEPFVVGTIEVSLKVSFWSPNPQYPYISNLAVKNAYRRQGIGKCLLTRCEELAYSWGYDGIQLHVLESNNSARQLYKKNGYRIIKKETYWNGFFNPSSTRLLLRKKLSES